MPYINSYRFGVAYDALIVAWLARGTTLGYTLPSTAEIAKLNTAVVNLRTNGVITGFDVLYFMMFGDSDMATLNVMAPSSHQITKYNSPTWTSGQGFKGNATDMYLDTNYNPSTSGVNYTLNSASRGIWTYSGAFTFSSLIDGVGSASGNRFVNASSNVHRINQGGANFGSTVNMSGAGYRAINRSGASAVELYNNASQAGTGTAASTAVLSQNQLIFQSNGGYSDTECGIYFMGRSFSSTEHGYIYTEFNSIYS